MSDAPADDPFVIMASAHIDLANRHAGEHSSDLAAVAIMHAAARYNAFAGSAPARTAEQLEEVRAELIDNQVKLFREALEHHYRGYVAELGTRKTA